MKFIRAELHNHSTESDGALSVESLAAYAAEKNFGVLALTDHNTTSGHATPSGGRDTRLHFCRAWR